MVRLTIPETFHSRPIESEVSASDALETTADAGEFAIPIVLITLIGAIFFLLFFLVYSAPYFLQNFSSIAFLATSLYRRVRGVDSQHWLATAISKTFWPFFATALVFAAFAWAVSIYLSSQRPFDRGGIASFSLDLY